MPLILNVPKTCVVAEEELVAATNSEDGNHKRPSRGSRHTWLNTTGTKSIYCSEIIQIDKTISSYLLMPSFL